MHMDQQILKLLNLSNSDPIVSERINSLFGGFNEGIELLHKMHPLLPLTMEIQLLLFGLLQVNLEIHM